MPPPTSTSTTPPTTRSTRPTPGISTTTWPPGRRWPTPQQSCPAISAACRPRPSGIRTRVLSAGDAPSPSQRGVSSAGAAQQQLLGEQLIGGGAGRRGLELEDRLTRPRRLGETGVDADLDRED